MEIRYVKPEDDRLEISNIYEQSWKTAYKGMIPDSFLESIPKGKWCKGIDTPGRKAMVFIEDGKFIGTSSFCKSRFDKWPDSGEIVSIYFLPEYFGKGYGKRLIEAVIEELRKDGYKDIFLWVLEDNTRARKFYEKCGFEKTEDYIDDIIDGKAIRDIRYIRRFCNDT